MTSSRKRVAEKNLGRISLYPAEISPSVGIGSTRDYLLSMFHSVDVEILPHIHKGLSKGAITRLAEGLARARIKNPSEAVQSYEPLFGEVEFEKRVLSGSARMGGIVYSGRKLEELYRDLLSDSQSLDRCAIVFTDRLVSTFSRDDLRHHLRTVVCGFPSIISIPGIVEAPAKPKEYYFLRQQLEAVGAGDPQLERLKSNFSGRYIDYDDSRAVEVLKGLTLQAVMFHLTLEPFCNKVTCRLFNAHWQEDLIKSQITSGKLCKRHADEIKKLGKSPRVIW